MKNSLDTAREEGKEEGRIEVAVNLIDLGLDNETIAKATNLSLEEIDKLRKE